MLWVSQKRSGAVVAFEDALDQIFHQGFHHPAQLLTVLYDQNFHWYPHNVIARGPDRHVFVYLLRHDSSIRDRQRDRRRGFASKVPERSKSAACHSAIRKGLPFRQF